MPAETAEGTVVAEQSAKAEPTTEQVPVSLQDEILKAMDDPAYVPVLPETNAETTEIETPITEGEGDIETQPAATGEAQSAEPEKPAGEAKDDDTWPDSAKARVAESTRRKNEEKAAREKAEQKASELESRNKQLEAELHGATRPVIRDIPLSDVYDEAGLEKARKDYAELLVFAENNRDGGFDLFKDKDGKPVDLTKEQVTKMKLNSEYMLNKGIDERRHYLAQREQADAAARTAYTPFTDKNSQWSQEETEILKWVPELERIPDYKMWIGHALHGRDLFVSALQKQMNGAKANGSTPEKVKDEARRIVESAKTERPPTAPTDRAFGSSTRDAEVIAAEKALDDATKSGDEEAKENANLNYIGAIYKRSLQRGRHQPVA